MHIVFAFPISPRPFLFVFSVPLELFKAVQNVTHLHFCFAAVTRCHLGYGTRILDENVWCDTACRLKRLTITGAPDASGRFSPIFHAPSSSHLTTLTLKRLYEFDDRAISNLLNGISAVGSIIQDLRLAPATVHAVRLLPAFTRLETITLDMTFRNIPVLPTLLSALTCSPHCLCLRIRDITTPSVCDAYSPILMRYLDLPMFKLLKVVLLRNNHGYDRMKGNLVPLERVCQAKGIDLMMLNE